MTNFGHNSLINYRREISLAGLWHDYANLFPMLDAKAQDALRDDIQQHGVREPVILFEGRILDGRNRYMAARDLGLDFPVADFDGADAEALAYVLSTNLHRRHLTESQRAAVAAKLANMTRGNPDFSKSANLPDSGPNVSQAEAAEMLNVSERSVRTAKTVIEQGTPELVAAVESGAISVSAAAAVAELPKDEQASTVADGPKAVKAKAKEIRDKKAAPEPVEDIDPNTVKVMRELAKLTPQAVAEDLIVLRERLASEKAKRREAEAEAVRLKEQVKDFTGDQADVIRRQASVIKSKDAEIYRANHNLLAEKKKNYALNKRVKELEAMEISL